jgi:hypothetical protein
LWPREPHVTSAPCSGTLARTTVRFLSPAEFIQRSLNMSNIWRDLDFQFGGKTSCHSRETGAWISEGLLDAPMIRAIVFKDCGRIANHLHSGVRECWEAFLIRLVTLLLQNMKVNELIRRLCEREEPIVEWTFRIEGLRYRVRSEIPAQRARLCYEEQ